jgi:hypothetical protein
MQPFSLSPLTTSDLPHVVVEVGVLDIIDHPR